MITITLQRNRPQGKAVTGNMTFTVLDRDFHPVPCSCNTLENADFLIPAGTYDVERNFSHKFKKFLPEILEVPDRTGIRIHRGTLPEHSQGCILTDMMGMANIDLLFNQIQFIHEDEKVSITVIDPA